MRLKTRAYGSLNGTPGGNLASLGINNVKSPYNSPYVPGGGSGAYHSAYPNSDHGHRICFNSSDSARLWYVEMKKKQNESFVSEKDVFKFVSLVTDRMRNL